MLDSLALRADCLSITVRSTILKNSGRLTPYYRAKCN